MSGIIPRLLHSFLIWLESVKSVSGTETNLCCRQWTSLICQCRGERHCLQKDGAGGAGNLIIEHSAVFRHHRLICKVNVAIAAADRLDHLAALEHVDVYLYVQHRRVNLCRHLENICAAEEASRCVSVPVCLSGDFVSDFRRLPAKRGYVKRMLHTPAPRESDRRGGCCLQKLHSRGFSSARI